jgi:uncharacterized protein YbcV (DUF1398 family)
MALEPAVMYKHPATKRRGPVKGAGTGGIVSQEKEQEAVELGQLYAEEGVHLPHKQRCLMLLNAIRAIHAEWTTNPKWIKKRSENSDQAEREFKKRHMEFSMASSTIFRWIVNILSDSQKRTISMMCTGSSSYEDVFSYAARKHMSKFVKPGITPITPDNDVDNKID